MAAYVNAVGTGSSTGSVTSSAIDTTGATLLRVWVISQQAGDPTVSDSKGNTWVKDGSTVQLNAGFTANVTCWRATTNTVGSGHTFTAVGTTSSTVFAVAVGPSAGGELSATTWNAVADATSPYASPSVSPGGDALLLTFGSSDSAGSPVTTDWSASSFTERAAVTDHNSFWGGSVATRAVSAGTYNSSFTENGTGATNGVVGIISVTESGSQPTITQQPSAQRLPSGISASFSVSATASAGSLTYQWQSNVTGSWVNISGQTASTYGVSLSAGDAYAVRVLVTDDNGTATSDPADAWAPVSKPPAWRQPSSRNILGGGAKIPQSSAWRSFSIDALFGPAASGGGSATGSFSSAWSVRNTATGAYSSAWRIRNTTNTGAFSGAWSIRNAATGSYSSAWSVKATATGSYSSAWSLRNTATGSASGAWTVRNAGSGAYSSAWSVRNAATGSATGAWSVRNAATGAYSGAWSIRAQATGSFSSAWSIESGGNTALGSFSGAWSIRNTATGSFSSAWSVRNTAAGTAAGAWSIRNAAAGAYSSAWSIRAAGPVASFSSAWSVSNGATGSFSGAWSVIGRAFGSYSGAWSIAGEVQQAAPLPIVGPDENDDTDLSDDDMMWIAVSLITSGVLECHP
jgi:hypothetical protein